jgi:hypothetical protein
MIAARVRPNPAATVEQILIGDQVPPISPVDWMTCRPWILARRQAIIDALLHDGAQLFKPDCGRRRARECALRIFDLALAELDNGARCS